jgi:hypothetical protein
LETDLRRIKTTWTTEQLSASLSRISRRFPGRARRVRESKFRLTASNGFVITAFSEIATERKNSPVVVNSSACLSPHNPRSPRRPNPSATIVIGLNSSAAFRFGSARLVGSAGWFASRFLSPSSHASRSSTRHDQTQALPAMCWPTLLGATKPPRADHHIALETRSGSGFPTIRPFERPASRPLWSLLPIALTDDRAKFLLSCSVRGHSIPIAPNIELAASSNPFLAHRRGLQLSPSLVMNP